MTRRSDSRGRWGGVCGWPPARALCMSWPLHEGTALSPAWEAMAGLPGGFRMLLILWDLPLPPDFSRDVTSSSLLGRPLGSGEGEGGNLS